MLDIRIDDQFRSFHLIIGYSLPFRRWLVIRIDDFLGLDLMDPPYNQDLAAPALGALATAGWLAPEALAVVELMAKEPFTPPEGFDLVDERKYGKARLVFLRAPG